MWETYLTAVVKHQRRGPRGPGGELSTINEGLITPGSIRKQFLAAVRLRLHDWHALM